MTDSTSIETETNTEQPELLVSSFGYEMLREILIPDLLGRDTPELLYWAGKRIARLYPQISITDIISFFYIAGWGNLEIKSEKKQEMEFVLSSPLIEKRFKERKDSTYQLEAGFLAQQFELQKKVVAEAFEDPKKRAKKVIFIVRWDSKDSIDIDE